MLNIKCKDGIPNNAIISNDNKELNIIQNIRSIDIRMRPNEYLTAEMECFVDNLDLDILPDMIKIILVTKEDDKYVEITVAEYKEILRRRQKNKYNF